VRFAAILILCVFGLTFGCAHSHDKFFWPDGTLCAVLKSNVLGTGEAQKTVSSPCAKLTYDTKDTGISKNATELGGKVAEGLTKGAVKGLVPLP
jgi:hypothetical protein